MTVTAAPHDNGCSAAITVAAARATGRRLLVTAIDSKILLTSNKLLQRGERDFGADKNSHRRTVHINKNYCI